MSNCEKVLNMIKAVLQKYQNSLEEFEVLAHQSSWRNAVIRTISSSNGKDKNVPTITNKEQTRLFTDENNDNNKCYNILNGVI